MDTGLENQFVLSYCVSGSMTYARFTNGELCDMKNIERKITHLKNNLYTYKKLIPTESVTNVLRTFGV